MKRCGAPQCNNIVNTHGFNHRQVQDKIFCDQECFHDWLASQGLHIVGDTPRPSTALSKQNGG